MVAIPESSTEFLSLSSSEENRVSFNSAADAQSGDEKFYEEIEAPKFVDFTSPDHYRPDDRYWFCLRVGCDQKHEEEMDSETIYKNFVLRVMAARSPNIRLRKALDRNASRIPTKCPLSAPPKTSKPRLAIMSSISKKVVDDKNGVIRPLFKHKSSSPKPKTPMPKMKPVAAKYLTTPRNRTCLLNQSSFRSVQNPKPTKNEASKSRVVAKALVFRSPKKTIKVKTSVELRTPISKICEGMDKLKISSQKKRTLVRSSKDSSSTPSQRQFSGRKVQRRPQGSLYPQTCTNPNANHQSSAKREVKGKRRQKNVPQRKFSGNGNMDRSKKNECREIKKQLSEKIVEGGEVEESTNGELSASSKVTQSTKNSDLASVDDSNRERNCVDTEGIESSRPQNTDGQETGSNDGNRKSSSESCGELVNHLVTTLDEIEKHEHEFTDGDDKENAAASDENRMHKDTKPNGRKVFGMCNECGEMKKKGVLQVENKSLKEGLISSGSVTKFKKPKPTNPKPFRLRTDERGVLKEATSERRTDSPARQCATANLRTPTGKLPKKQGGGIQKRTMSVDTKISKGLERFKEATPVTPESHKRPELKQMSSPHESNAIQRLEKFRKMNSPIQKCTVRPQGPCSTKQETTSFLIPGQKLEVIHEISPEVPQLRMAGKLGIDDCAAHAAAGSSSCGKRSSTVPREPSFHSVHAPRSCIKKLTITS